MCVIIYIFYNSNLYKLSIRYNIMVTNNKQVSKDKVSDNQLPTKSETLFKMTYSNNKTETYKIDVSNCLIGLGYTNANKYQYFLILF
jgi:hypothetical protein